jgi:hypothetical protein
MVKWLRHRPFTAVTRVRVPVGSPNFNQRPLPRADFLFIIVFCGIIFGAGHRIIFQKQYRIESLLIYARVAELADALDLGSSGKPWGFKSLRAHQKKHRKVLFVCARRNLNLPLYQVPTCAPRRNKVGFAPIFLIQKISRPPPCSSFSPQSLVALWRPPRSEP